MREIWNVVSATAGVLAVALALFVFFQDRTDKSQRLEVHQISRTTLVNPALSSPTRRVEISYNGRKISDYAVFQFRISNSGGQPIRTADYEVPVTLNFGNVEQILWADQTSADPDALRIETQIKSKVVQLSNVLLNPKDSVTLEVATVPEPGKIPGAEPSGRIAGVKKIDFVLTVASTEPPLEFRDWVKALAYVQGFLVIVLLLFQLWMRRRLQ